MQSSESPLELPIICTIEVEFLGKYPFNGDDDVYPLPCLEQVCEVRYEAEPHLEET